MLFDQIALLLQSFQHNKVFFFFNLKKLWTLVQFNWSLPLGAFINIATQLYFVNITK